MGGADDKEDGSKGTKRKSKKARMVVNKKRSRNHLDMEKTPELSQIDIMLNQEKQAEDIGYE